MTNEFRNVLLATLLGLFQATQLLAHGEDKPGPNGGFIRMPGAFHTEIVPTNSRNTFKVFLLDLSFKNPMTNASNVKLTYKNKSTGSDAEASCKKEKLYFECSFDEKTDLQSGLLLIVANRLGVQGNDAKYHLPLSLSSIQSMNHNMMHKH